MLHGRDAGVGDEDVDGSGFVDQAPDLGTVAEIDGQCARTELGGERVEHVGAPAGHDQLAAAGGDSARDRVADAARGAGEQHGGAGDLHDV